MSGLSDFPVDVARCFFSIPASDGFLLAGGGALLASGLTTRLTRDLDFFGAPTVADVTHACEQFDNAELLAWAQEIDLGFDHGVLEDMFGTLNQFTNEQIPIDPLLVSCVRGFCESWSHDLPATRIERLLSPAVARQREVLAVHFRHPRSDTASS